MSKHTPAPWNYEKTAWSTLKDGTELGQIYTISNTKDFDRKSIAKISAIGRDDDELNPFRYQKEECEANAKLIAAAPELLEALERALHDFRKMTWTEETYIVIESAIKKATL